MLISVIIPVYNAEPYLRRCLDSVLASACGGFDFEIIIINDGSTDGSLAICNEYAGRDRRIRLITQENQGVSAARNRGLREALGEWLIFLDADDFITDSFLGMTARPEYRQTELILFQFATCASQDSSVRIHDSPQAPDSPADPDGSSDACCYQGEAMLRLVRRILVPRPLDSRCSLDFRTPCARAYRRSILEQYSIRFSPDIKIGEDLLFNLEYQLQAKSCVLIPRTVYFYAVHGDSSSHHFNPGLHENHARLLQAVRDVLDKCGVYSSLEEDYASYALENLTYVLIHEIFSPHSPRTYRENRKLCREMRQNPIYVKAFEYNRKTGILPRRILVLFFRLKCYLLVNLISRVSYAYLEKR